MCTAVQQAKQYNKATHHRTLDVIGLLSVVATPGAAQQICMAAAVRGAAAGTRVVYLDTSNAVTRRRLIQLHAALPQVGRAPGARREQRQC